MKSAVIYARYSCDAQTEQSIEGQLRVCNDYAERNDIVIVDTYIDRAMTGTNDNRPDFQRMIKDSNKKHWDYVLVYKLDRFSRNKYESTKYKHLLSKNNVKVVSAMENIPDTPEGIILESLLEGMNQYYSVELSQKIRRGMNESRQKGYFTGGFLLYGYKVVDKKFVIDEAQAEIVRYIYEQYSIGVYVREILTALKEKGVIHRGKPFSANGIYSILKNEKYTGVYRRGEEVFEHTFPRIISAELYEKVQKRFKQNRFGKKSKKNPIMLKHKITCGYCGKPITSDTGTARNGSVIYYYKCWSRKNGGTCKKTTIRKDLLESIIINSIINQLTCQNSMDLLVQNLLKIQDAQISENSMLSVLLHDKRIVETALNNIVSAVEQGVISNSTNKRLQELEKQQAQLERQILLEKNKLTIKLTEEEIRAFFAKALSQEPQMLINYLVNKVILYDDKMIIKYNDPLKTSPDENQGFFFYEKTEAFSYKISNHLTITKIKINVKISL